MQGIEEVVEDNFTKGLRVLIIEDDPVSQKILESLMCNCKYHRAPLDLHAFSNSLESRLYELFSMNNMELKFPREGKDEMEMVISDAHMPDIDGFMLLQLIRVEMDLPSISRFSA
ncbi:hypothetical protein VPH35_132198 [Triticum aestivum]